MVHEQGKQKEDARTKKCANQMENKKRVQAILRVTPDVPLLSNGLRLNSIDDICCLYVKINRHFEGLKECSAHSFTLASQIILVAFGDISLLA